jgi:diguanylate cyclase (GGDEF)-like protein
MAAALRLSETDPLTGVPNRRALERRLDEEILRAARFSHPLAIGLADIDDFKTVNDRFGHGTGDAVLTSVAHELQRVLRAIDVVGRYGGEEFLFLLPETDAAGALVASQRLLDTLRDCDLDGLPPGHRVSISIGLSEFPAHGRTGSDLIAAADEALYMAKAAGKNRARTAAR